MSSAPLSFLLSFKVPCGGFIRGTIDIFAFFTPENHTFLFSQKVKCFLASTCSNQDRLRFNRQQRDQNKISVQQSNRTKNIRATNRNQKENYERTGVVIERNVKHNVPNSDLNRYRPQTRGYIKQETEDSKESLKCALYSPVKIEPPPLEIIKYENTLSTGIINRQCSICNITFLKRELYLDHELHSHKTKDTPIIGLKTFCCNICNKSYKIIDVYRNHMANLNNVCIPLTCPRLKPSPLKTPDFNDRNYYCISCDYKVKCQRNYHRHLAGIHRMSQSCALKRTSRARKQYAKKSTSYQDILFAAFSSISLHDCNKRLFGTEQLLFEKVYRTVCDNIFLPHVIEHMHPNQTIFGTWLKSTIRKKKQDIEQEDTDEKLDIRSI
ncbi:hypothetical protein EDC94DRAFT_688227 [Helicostylum pulchrum]|nr:hypothetical protein EDC94DRAFT_688227 [Helicostylum pulchrum]